jgi:hypothetical protein
VPSAWRIGTLMDGYDRWWKNDPNGPAELAEALRLHAPPFFEGRRSLESQAMQFGTTADRWRRGDTHRRIYLALTLYRLGELDEACEVLRDPPKTTPAPWLAQVESVRQWLGCRPAVPDGRGA